MQSLRERLKENTISRLEAISDKSRKVVTAAQILQGLALVALEYWSGVAGGAMATDPSQSRSRLATAAADAITASQESLIDLLGQLRYRLTLIAEIGARRSSLAPAALEGLQGALCQLPDRPVGESVRDLMLEKYLRMPINVALPELIDAAHEICNRFFEICVDITKQLENPGHESA